jgi:dolichol-phosphate mannosyltransferase
MDLSIILPTLNEKGNIEILIDEIINNIPINLKKEIIIIDDNSDDETYSHCINLYKNYKNIKVILRKDKRSLGGSVGEGISIANGNKIIVMDTDLNHNPIHIRELLYLTNSYDLVSCSRYLLGGSMKNKSRFLASYFYNVFLRIILGTGVKDNTGGFFCIKRSVLKNLDFKKIFYGYGEYFFRLLFYIKKKKFLIKEIPTKYNERKYGQSKSRFMYMIINYFFSAVKLRMGL